MLMTYVYSKHAHCKRCFRGFFFSNLGRVGCTSVKKSSKNQFPHNNIEGFRIEVVNKQKEGEKNRFVGYIWTHSKRKRKKWY